MEYQLRKQNRINKQTPNSDKSHWCKGCDKNTLKDGGTCKVCGRKDEKFKVKHSKLG